MKLSEGFIVTRRDFPSDEKNLSSKLLIKSGMIIKNSSGVYSYLPLGFRVLFNIEKIIRNELKKYNASEVALPSLVKENILKVTNRKKIFDDEMFTLNDRNNKKLLLCPTSEDLFAYLASSKIQSYKDLHFTLYQIDKKFRDEKNPEYGLVRKNEFYMLEAYSFDSELGGLEVSYDKMYLAFKNIFNKLNINTITVEASSPYMFGMSNEEFQVLSDYGDNEIVKCSNCTYACNIEDATNKSIVSSRSFSSRKKELVELKDANTIKEISEQLNVFSSNILKSLVFKVDNQYKMILLKGESELNVKKLKELFNTPNVEMPSLDELSKIGISINSVGPIDVDMDIIADNEVRSMHNFVCGSNKENYFYINANIDTDFKIKMYADLKLFDKNSLCPKCNSKCDILKGIEVGEILKIGNGFSKSYNLSYIDEINSKEFVYMGAYQIGLDRCISAIVEENHDEAGIIWPMSVAPYKVAIVVANMNDKDSLKFATALYNKLNKMEIDVILDDRKETIGVKLNDMDLIGIPLRITVGKKLYTDRTVDLKLRNEKQSTSVDINNLLKTIVNIVDIDDK